MSDKKETIEKVNIEPVFVGFDDGVIKIKGRLIVTSFIAIFAALGEIGIDPDSRFLGVKFSGLNDDLIYSGLFIIIIYLLINFVWCSYDALQEWEIRVTGTGGAFKPSDKTNLDELVHPKLPDDPRNSTMYFWWNTQAGYIKNITPIINEAKSSISDIEESVRNMRETQEIPISLANIGLAVEPIKDSWRSLESSIKAIESSLEDDQLNSSMRVFDRRYKFFMYSQNIRWILMDYLFPIVSGTTALYFLSGVVTVNV